MATPLGYIHEIAWCAERRPLARIVVVTLLRAEFIRFLPAIGRDREARAAIRASLNPTSLSNLAEQGTTNDEGYRFQLRGKTTNRIEEPGKNHLKLLLERPLFSSQLVR